LVEGDEDDDDDGTADWGGCNGNGFDHNVAPSKFTLEEFDNGDSDLSDTGEGDGQPEITSDEEHSNIAAQMQWHHQQPSVDQQQQNQQPIQPQIQPPRARQSALRQHLPQHQQQSLGAVDELEDDPTSNELQDIAALKLIKQNKDADAPDYGKAQDMQEAKDLLKELEKEIEAATQVISDQTMQTQSMKQRLQSFLSETKTAIDICASFSSQALQSKRENQIKTADSRRGTKRRLYDAHDMADEYGAGFDDPAFKRRRLCVGNVSG